MIEIRIRRKIPITIAGIEYVTEVKEWMPLEKAIQLAHEEEAKRIQDANNNNNEKDK